MFVTSSRKGLGLSEALFLAKSATVDYFAGRNVKPNDAAKEIASALTQQHAVTIPPFKVALAAGEVAGAVAIREQQSLKAAEFLAASAARLAGGSKSIRARVAGLVAEEAVLAKHGTVTVAARAARSAVMHAGGTQAEAETISRDVAADAATRGLALFDASTVGAMAAAAVTAAGGLRKSAAVAAGKASGIVSQKAGGSAADVGAAAAKAVEAAGGNTRSVRSSTVV